ncbi:hypothetical protein EON62_06170 [archaeon]|nr:MAG: hypothetical protein EON62_06170 [archaeon]
MQVDFTPVAEPLYDPEELNGIIPVDSRKVCPAPRLRSCPVAPEGRHDVRHDYRGCLACRRLTCAL